MRPKLRFHEFLQSGFWFKNKLGDEAHSIIAGGDIDRDKFTDNGTYPILANALVNDGIIGYYENHYTIKGPAVTVTGRGDIGHAKARNFNFTPVVRLLTIKSKHNVIFLENSINNYKSSFESTGVPQLTIPKLYNYELYFPIHIQEEEKIGNFFKKIDEMIQLQQSKLNKVKNIKSAYLSEMFPKEGEKYPKKRFEGFTEPWKEYKLKDIGRSLTGLSGKSKKDFGHGEAEFVTYMNVFNNPIAKGTQTDQVEIDENQTEVEYGDIFFTVSSETPNEVGMSSVWLYNRPNVYLNSFCFGFRPTINLNPYYMAYMLRSPEIRKKFILLAQGISRYNISKTKAMELLFPIPSNEEQEKIGQFFKNLDNQISIEEEKLSKLENLKQAYLNDMFV